MKNAFTSARDAILLKRFGKEEVTKVHVYNDDFEDMEIPMVGDDVEYGELKETKEAKQERK